MTARLRGPSRKRLAWLAACVVASIGLVTAARADDRWARAAREALAPRSIDGARFVSWPSHPLLDDARQMVGAELAWATRGTRGAGATVCVIDTGVDLAHRDLLDASGRSRVRWLLDLDGPPRGAHPDLEAMGGGAVWSAEEIDDARANEQTLPTDWHGHGTAIASAAVGDDSPTILGDPGLRAGIAPEAELVVVRALRRSSLGFADDDVVRGVRFCADARVSDPARTVILLALGGHDGAHDGSSAYERALSEVASRGAAVVVAAGNDGGRAQHAAAPLVGDHPARLVVRLPPREIDEALFAVVLRGAREVRATLPSATPSAWVARGQTSEGEGLRIDARDERATYVVLSGSLPSGELVLEGRGDERGARVLEAWIVEQRWGPALFEARFSEGAMDEGEITIPATADGVIAVGATLSREVLEPETGSALVLELDEAGRASFSARGPRVDGAPLPTLLAPGGWVIAARSSAMDPDDPESLFAGSRARFEERRRGEDRLAIAGTSVAAAIVAGAIALGRPAEPGSGQDARALAASAAPIARARAPFDPRAGAGLLDVPAYLARRASPGERSDSLEVGCTRTAVAPQTEDLAVVVRSSSGGAARIRARVTGQAWSGTRAMTEGLGVVPVRVPARALGRVLDVEVEVDGELLHACAVTVRDVGAEVPALAAHCAAGPGRTLPPRALWGLVSILFIALTRRPRRACVERVSEPVVPSRA